MRIGAEHCRGNGVKRDPMTVRPRGVGRGPMSWPLEREPEPIQVQTIATHQR